MKKSLVLFTLAVLFTACSTIPDTNETSENQSTKETPIVTNFEECEKIGSTIMESYPRQCRYGDQSFAEEIGNELEKIDSIIVNSPRPNQEIKSPLTITGEAKGPWFFEASFPVEIIDENGVVIAQHYAMAKEDWMTEDFVKFESVIEFNVDNNLLGKKGTLILRNDNPSGLPEYAESLELPIVFIANTEFSTPCTQEAKLCPNGSSVGRTGPNCEFETCPELNP